MQPTAIARQAPRRSRRNVRPGHVHGARMPSRRRYRETAWARLATRSLRRIRLTWNFTVPSEITSASAITRLELTVGEQAQHVELAAGQQALEHGPVVTAGQRQRRAVGGLRGPASAPPWPGGSARRSARRSGRPASPGTAASARARGAASRRRLALSYAWASAEANSHSTSRSSTSSSLVAAAVGVQHADHVRADDERCRGVRPPAHHLLQAGVDARVHPRVGDHRRAAAAQHLGLDQRVLEPQRPRAQPVERRARARAVAGEVRGLGEHLALADEAEQRAPESSRRAHSACGARSSIVAGEVCRRSSSTAPRTRSSASKRASKRAPQPVARGLVLAHRAPATAAKLGHRSVSASISVCAARCRLVRRRSRRPARLVDAALRAGPGLGDGRSSRAPRSRVPATARGRTRSPASSPPRARTNRATASARLVAPSLRRMFLTWYLTVPSRTTSALAIAEVGQPAREQPQDLQLARGQRRPRVRPSGRRRPAPPRAAACRPASRGRSGARRAPPIHCTAELSCARCSASVWRRTARSKAPERPSANVAATSRSTASSGRRGRRVGVQQPDRRRPGAQRGHRVGVPAQAAAHRRGVRAPAASTWTNRAARDPGRPRTPAAGTPARPDRRAARRAAARRRRGPRPSTARAAAAGRRPAR